MTHHNNSRKGFPGSIEDHDQISGPVTITYHPNVMNNKDIYIFGDIHLENDGLCQMVFDNKPIEIVDFFDKVFKNTDVPIDFFLEIPVVSLNKAIPSIPLSIPVPTPHPNGPMARLRDVYEGCFDGNLPNECINRYPNTLFHSMDIRQKTNGARNTGKLTFFTQYSTILGQIASDCSNSVIMSLVKDKMPGAVKEDLLGKMGKIILLFSHYEIIKVMKEYVRIPHHSINFLMDDKNFEYYEKVEYPGVNQLKDRIDQLPLDLKKKLLDFFDQRILKILKSYKELQKEIEENWNLILKNINKENKENDLQGTMIKFCALIKFKSLIMFNVDGLFFDISNLAAICKILSDTKSSGGEIWVYAGEGHAGIFREFIIGHLKSNNFYESSAITQRCQDIKEIKKQSSKKHKAK